MSDRTDRDRDIEDGSMWRMEKMMVAIVMGATEDQFPYIRHEEDRRQFRRLKKQIDDIHAQGYTVDFGYGRE